MRAYEIYMEAMREQGVEIDGWDDLPDSDKNAWDVVQEYFYDGGI